MKKVDIEALLLPENYEELEEKENNLLYRPGLGWKKNSYSPFLHKALNNTMPPLPVKQYSKEEIQTLEQVMKKEGKL